MKPAASKNPQSKNAQSKNPQAAKAKNRPPEQTFEEPKYLRRLVEHGTPVRVKLSNNEEVAGIIEFYDANFIRITRRDGQPNLFVFKHDIKYLYEDTK